MFPILVASQEAKDAWLAALIDGEGSIRIGVGLYKDGEKRRYHVDKQISISNVSKELLECAKQLIGLSSTQKQGPNGYYLTVSPKTQQQLLTRIIPFLVVKKQLAQLLLEYIEYRKTVPQPYTVVDYNYVVQSNALQYRSRSLKHLEGFKAWVERPRSLRGLHWSEVKQLIRKH